MRTSLFVSPSSLPVCVYIFSSFFFILFIDFIIIHALTLHWQGEWALWSHWRGHQHCCHTVGSPDHTCQSSPPTCSPSKWECTQGPLPHLHAHHSSQVKGLLTPVTVCRDKLEAILTQTALLVNALITVYKITWNIHVICRKKMA